MTPYAGVAPLTRRATAVYRLATEEQLASGARWYPDAHELARDQASRHQLTIEQTAGILAALSPRLGWGPNVHLAERVLGSGGMLEGGALARSLTQASRIHAGTPPLDVLGGPKTRAFYLAILTAGEADEVVIDRHAWDMLVGKRGASSPTLRQYRDAAEKMRRAARIVGRPASQTQAITWIAWRSRHWSATAFGVRQRELESTKEQS